MPRNVGGFHFKKDNFYGDFGGEHHWRCEVSADHYGGDGTPYYQLPDDDWKRFFVSGWFTGWPISPWDTDVTFEEYRTTMEVRDGSSNDTELRSPEPDPWENQHEMLFDVNITIGFGPIGISHSLQASSMSFTDNYNGNPFWHHWEIPTGDMPIGRNDAHGCSVVADTRLPPGSNVTLTGWNSSTYSYVDPSWAGIAFRDTSVLGGFCHFDVVND
ncbi:hypothetical protein [Haladaptatus sp. W1]|uniref:hypothetical protein n=1 Tax=Haladaptatus sp. W1 TaxID=1897478 RepID=UPI001112CA02|nr:hypothetical protein [Haladaptatus sp. W1]